MITTEEINMQEIGITMAEQSLNHVSLFTGK